MGRILVIGATGLIGPPFFVMIVAWFTILFTGRTPRGGMFGFVEGVIRRNIRVTPLRAHPSRWPLPTVPASSHKSRPRSRAAAASWLLRPLLLAGQGLRARPQ
jgi:hypothetical protein